MKPHIPDQLPLQGLDWMRLARLTSKAMQSVARYDGLISSMVNPEVLLSPLTSQEAILSSRIEGTQTSITEVLQHEAGEQFDEEKRGNIHEVLNYRHALLTAERELEYRTVTCSLIKQLHKILMTEVRGGDKTPGEFRKLQNWIAPEGTPMEQARFVPPSPMIVPEYMEYLEHYISKQDLDPPLIQLAIVHGQFEIIHPFNDGNGRLGRMLVPLLLYQQRVLHRPVFYVSEYLELVEDDYRQKLLAITADDDWQGWIEFFLSALYQQAEMNINKAKAIIALYERMKIAFAESTKSAQSAIVLDTFFKRPIITSVEFGRSAEISNRATANNILKRLCDTQLISVLLPGAGQRPTVYMMPELIEIAEGKRLKTIE